MSYKALYRKYRPQSFEDVSDQEHITRTLKNALKEGRVSHAYLFSGPRGVGKTSVAKILAKAVNCTNNMNGEPCNSCEICEGISNGSISDVIEIDAASNNGVDEIRDLRDKVKYLPSVCRYKVYIIDEVHMLTTQAFNALLKTLEEPPKHVIFILCTTEPQKVPQTIQSRCQRFEFHLISEKEIEARLKDVARYEYIDIDEDALKALAEVSEGGMRDALSLLDQVDAYSKDSHITLDDVLEVSGKLSNDNLIGIARALEEFSALDAIELLDALLKAGKEIPKIMNSLVVFYKDILVIKNVKPDLMKVGYDSKEFRELVNSISNQKLYKNIDILSEAISNMRYADNQRLYTELAFIKIADNENMRQMEPLSSPFVAPKKVEPKPVVETKVETPVIEKPVIEEPIKEEPKPVEIKEEPKPVEEPVKVETPIENINPVLKAEADNTMMSGANNKGTFDITIIEKILNGASKPFKEEINSSWANIIKSTRGTELHKSALLLNDAVVRAASNDYIIITFDDVAYCNLAMKYENRQNIKKILSNAFNKEVNFIAIPSSTWKDVSDEFIQQYRANKTTNNRAFIKLTPVYVDGLRIEDEKDAPKEDDRFKDLIDSFEGIIEVK